MARRVARGVLWVLTVAAVLMAVFLVVGAIVYDGLTGFGIGTLIGCLVAAPLLGWAAWAARASRSS
jgi:hypothetical protein